MISVLSRVRVRISLLRFRWVDSGCICYMEIGRCCIYLDYGRNGNDEVVRSVVLFLGGK